MQKALIFAAGAAAGFVLGTRSGRQTYEKMRHQSVELWHNPTVQEKVSEATEAVKDKAPQVQHKVGELAKKATHRGSDTNTPANGVSLGDAAGRTPMTTEPATVTSPTEGKHTQGPN